MICSKYNLITKIDENNYAIYNPLSGAFDIADTETKELFLQAKPRNIEEKLSWIERGYFFNTKQDEENYIKKRYDEFIEETKKNPAQFLFVPTYGCNFNCDYCYQKGLTKDASFPDEKIIDSFVDFVANYKKNNSNKDVFVTLFGGEPLLSGEKAKKSINYFVESLAKNKIDLAVVTNGYTLSEYIDILKKVKLREIHISFDGDEEIHNKRRYSKEGEGSFAKILEGVKKAVEYKIPVNIRLIIDKKTIDTLPSLAEKFEKLGFLDLPKNLFKTSLGRNYELINKYMKEEDLFKLDEMYAYYANLMKKYPLLQKLHTPSFFGISYLIEKGEMYYPNFDSCPATKSELVFDYTGKIYGCTASCGRTDYEVGTFYPELKFDHEKTKDWEKRSILSIPECVDCSVGVVCGGGCGVIALEKNGKVLSPNCKPIKEIMDIGINFYKNLFI
ncbi:MAG: hypothetical protein A2086_13595 [Spirochaetes bacterium GWD1_27_9]|nr:MAG: hypothetical protein A2Z98_08105 [Spirochaetes bacterium GWB1_27_13]OHD23631.1 MAG: hypothetical protein A2Y34_01085 [Spirochaetes bacterium GWC1_27_15]OHD39260.1 MAG: hypothetical protein A2086_13595 [Spirochaetes bacterium GWD1_27_9]